MTTVANPPEIDLMGAVPPPALTLILSVAAKVTE
jgi:hypothetical protein